MLFILLIVHHNFNYFSNINKVNVISIGQGDCILIKLSHNKGNILIDTGGKTEFSKEKWQIRKNSKTLAENTIIPYLKSEGISKLDYLVLTHGDYDHMGESVNLVNNFKVDNVVFNCGEYNNLEKNLIKTLNKDNIKYYTCIKELKIYKYKMQFLNTREYDNENDNSSVVYFNYDGYKFLLTHYPTITTRTDAGKPLKKCLVNLCGHSHTKDPFEDWEIGMIYHCEVDAHDCAPVSLDKIIADLKQKIN